MIDISDKDLAKELIMVLPYIDKNYTNNIPEDLLKKIVDMAADSKKEVSFDKNKKLSEQELSDECKDLIALLYYSNSDSATKKELLESWKNNS